MLVTTSQQRREPRPQVLSQHRSLSLGVEMDMINDILVAHPSPTTATFDFPQKGHPLRDIFGTKCLMSSSLGFNDANIKANSIKSKGFSPERTGLPPYGLYPMFTLLSIRKSVGSLEPIKTSLRTYQGPRKLGIILMRLYEG